VTAPSTATPWTVARLLTWTTGYLKEHGSESPRLDAEVLLAHARGCPRIDLYVQFDTVVDEAVRTRFRELVRKRAEAEPVAYLVGRKEFFSLELEVNPAVLIPRPDSEFVVLQFLDLTSATDSLEVADVGTGSGNIAVAAAKHRPAADTTSPIGSRFTKGTCFPTCLPVSNSTSFSAIPPISPPKSSPCSRRECATTNRRSHWTAAPAAPALSIGSSRKPSTASGPVGSSSWKSVPSSTSPFAGSSTTPAPSTHRPSSATTPDIHVSLRRAAAQLDRTLLPEFRDRSPHSPRWHPPLNAL
jgi:hypothetical protein